MKEYGYFQAMYMSFYSRKIYRDVAKNWGASVIFYLFLVLLITWSIMMFKYQPLISAGFHEFMSRVGNQVPEMQVKEGILHTPENRPYLIKDPDNNNETVAIIDTSGKYLTMADVPPQTIFLATKDTTYYLDSNKTLKVNKLSKNLTFNLSPQSVKEVLEKLIRWVWLLLLPVVLFFSMAYRLIQAVFYALIGLLFARMANAPLTYVEILKLVMVAVTPAIVFATFIDWFNMLFRFEWLVCFFIAMIYLVFAIGANNPNATAKSTDN